MGLRSEEATPYRPMTGAVAVLIEFAHCLASLILLRAVQLRSSFLVRSWYSFFETGPEGPELEG